MVQVPASPMDEISGRHKLEPKSLLQALETSAKGRVEPVEERAIRLLTEKLEQSPDVGNMKHAITQQHQNSMQGQIAVKPGKMPLPFRPIKATVTGDEKLEQGLPAVAMVEQPDGLAQGDAVEDGTPPKPKSSRLTVETTSLSDVNATKGSDAGVWKHDEAK